MSTKAHNHKPGKEHNFTSCQDSRIPKKEDTKTDNQGIWARIEKFLNTHHSFCFCLVLVLIVTLFGIYLSQSNENLRDSQQKIVECYKNVQQIVLYLTSINLLSIEITCNHVLTGKLFV